MTLEGLEAGLKFDDFSGLPRGVPDPETEPKEGNSALFGLHTKTLEA